MTEYEGLTLSAVFAAAGFVGKLIVDRWLEWRRTVRERRSRLIDLQSHLLASRHVFWLQAGLRNDLCKEFERTDPDLEGKPYDDVLAQGYASATPQQKLTHALIRQYTVGAIKPLNDAMLQWLAQDTYYKAQTRGSSAKLALALRALEVHLILWKAKFELWIPNNPERALVYMLDEKRHGVGFPTGIEKLVGRLTGGTLGDGIAEER